MPTQNTILNVQNDFDNLATAQDQRHMMGTKMMRQMKLAMVAQYDFANVNQGGAIGAITLIDQNTGKAAQLPKGAVISFALIHILTTLTSGGSATIAVGTGQAANDLKAATAVASYSAGLLAAVPVESAATAIIMAADGTMSMTIATAALTAGKFNVLVEYIMSI